MNPESTEDDATLWIPYGSDQYPDSSPEGLAVRARALDAHFLGHGELFGVRRRDQADSAVWIQLYVEDDDIFHPKDVLVDIYWIDDLIAALQQARERAARVPKIRKHLAKVRRARGEDVNGGRSV